MSAVFSDRRANVFFIFGILCLILLWPCPEKFRTVGLLLSVTYFVLALASWADHRGRTSRPKKR